jgi:hypothetical protein
MFRMIIAAAAIAGAALPSQAEVLFRGVYEITKTNTACTDGPRVGDIDNAQFHPRGFGNSNFSALTIIYEFGGMSYEIDNGNFGTSYKRVVTEGQGWSTFGADKPANILVNPIPSITNSTSTLTLVGKLRNPYGRNNQTACEASFRAVMYKVID